MSSAGHDVVVLFGLWVTPSILQPQWDVSLAWGQRNGLFLRFRVNIVFSQIFHFSFFINFFPFFKIFRR